MNIRWKPIHSIILLLMVLFIVTLGFNAALLVSGIDSRSDMTLQIVMEIIIMILLDALLSIPIILGFKRESKAMIIFFSAVFLVVMFFAILIGVSTLGNIELDKRMRERETHSIAPHNHAIDDVLAEIP
ncbi:MAG: hypothetical protein IKX68_06730 [Clostridiales bacterium]|nr:hypothetical protein [Clostridiales bacterium]